MVARFICVISLLATVWLSFWTVPADAASIGAPGVAVAQNQTTDPAATTPPGGQSRPPSAFAPRQAITAGREPPGAASGGFTGMFDGLWRDVRQLQARLHRDLAGAVRRLKTDNLFVAVFGLVSLSFVYGVVHALGPGHGKMIITSYAVANERTARRGALVAVLAGLFQALSAILLVTVMLLVLRCAGLDMRETAGWLETASYALVAVLGLWLLWSALARIARRPAVAPHGAHGHGHDHAHHHHAHGNDHHHHDHDASGACCGHQHLPGPAMVEEAWSWRRALALALSVGIRPCSGAIIVLVFAIAQGLFWAGVAATFAMSVGTALTVAILTVLAVGGRDLTARIAGGRSSRGARLVGDVAAVLGSLAIVVLGGLLFAGSLAGPTPF